jgi:hypothetical protein
MTKVNNFWVPKIDSFKIWVLRDAVEIINITLIDKLKLVRSDGLIVDEVDGKSVPIDLEDGRKFKFWRYKQYDFQDKNTPEYIGIIINAKHLKERYFEGINSGNIDIILDELNSLNVIRITKDVLLNAKVNDLDICFDFPAKIEPFHKLIQRFSDMVKQQWGVDKNAKHTKEHLALYLNNRRTGKPSRPYFKFYHKTIELKNNSKAFADKFLKNVDFENIGRCEMTLANAKHFKHHNIKSRTLAEMFEYNEVPFKKEFKTLGISIEHNGFKGVLQKSYNGWFIKREINFAPKDFWYIKIIKGLIGWIPVDSWPIFEDVMSKEKNAHTKAKMRQCYNDIMAHKDAYQQEKERVELVEEVEQFFRIKNTGH